MTGVGHAGPARAIGIDAIPSHVVGGRYLLVGAQPISVFRQVVDHIAGEDARPPDGPSSGRDGR